MRRCSICGSFLVPCNEGINHIGFESPTLRWFSPSRFEARRPIAYVCQSCIYAIQNQLEYGVSYQYADV